MEENDVVIALAILESLRVDFLEFFPRSILQDYFVTYLVGWFVNLNTEELGSFADKHIFLFSLFLVFL